MGLLARRSSASALRAARHWPLVFLGLAAFLFVRNDPRAWPLGPAGFWESLTLPDVLQHRAFVVLVVAFGVFEWAVRTRRLRAAPVGLRVPAAVRGRRRPPADALARDVQPEGGVPHRGHARAARPPRRVRRLGPLARAAAARGRPGAPGWLWTACFTAVGAAARSSIARGEDRAIMSRMIAGHATARARRVTSRTSRTAAAPITSARLDGGAAHVVARASGTYLGREDDATDAAVPAGRSTRALERGINVIDTAVNYRHQRSERAVGAALAEAIRRRAVRRDEVIVATKGGFIPSTARCRATRAPTSPRRTCSPASSSPATWCGIALHGAALSRRPDRPQPRRTSGSTTIDVYYLHNPESRSSTRWPPEEFLRRAARAPSRRWRRRWRRARIARVRHRRPGTATAPIPARPAPVARGDGRRRRATWAAPTTTSRSIQLPYNLGMPEAFTRANQRVGGELRQHAGGGARLGVYVMASASVLPGPAHAQSAAGRRRVPAGPRRPTPSARSSSCARRRASAPRSSA